MEKMVINKDKYDFLHFITYGNVINNYDTAVAKAYLDVCRTIRGFGKVKNKEEIKLVTSKLIAERTKAIIESKTMNQLNFDSWHRKTCVDLVEIFFKHNIIFSIGQGQKWINMTFKNLYILDESGVTDHIISFLHIPIDNYILEEAKSLDGFIEFDTAWSKIESYDRYLEFQKWFASMWNIPPFKKELSMWIESAIKITK